MIVCNINGITVNLMKAEYSRDINDVAYFEAVYGGVDNITRSASQVGNSVEIYDNGVFKIKGTIRKRFLNSGGGIVVRGHGIEREFAKKKCPVDSGKRKVYNDTTDNAIFETLVTSVTGWSADTSGSTSVNLNSFRTTSSMSVWKGIERLRRLTGKDFDIDYSTKTMKLVDKLGNSDVFVFNEGTEISSVKVTEEEPDATKVVVYGKGDGDSQIEGSAGSGDDIREIIDRNIITESEANQRAQKELEVIQNNIENYSFDILNPNLDIGLGDEGTISSVLIDGAQRAVVITEISKSVDLSGVEKLSVTVTNPEYRRARKSLTNDILESEEETDIDRTSMQGSGNITSFVTSDSINNDKSMFLEFNVGNNFLDDSGELAIEKLEMDYILDPFIIQGGGTVSESNRSPSLDGNTANHKHDPSSPSHNHGTSSTTSGSVNTSGDHNENEAIGLSVFDGSDLPRTAKIPDLGSSVSDMDWAIVTVSVSVKSIGSGDIRLRIRNLDANSTAYDENINLLENGCFVVTVMFVGNDCFGDDDIEARVYNNSGEVADITLSISVSAVVRHTHTVDIGNVSGTSASVSDNDRSPSLSGNTSSHNHSVSISDGDASVDDINGSSVTIVLQKFDGSSWNDVETKTINEIFDTDIDWTEHITTGLHRFKFNTNNSDFDHSRAVIRIKHLLEG